jgi:hypothetical protein
MASAFDCLLELKRKKEIDNIENASIIGKLKEEINLRFKQELASKLKDIVQTSFQLNGDPDLMEEEEFYEGAASYFIRNKELRHWAYERADKNYAYPLQNIVALAIYAKDLAKKEGILIQKGINVYNPKVF